MKATKLPKSLVGPFTNAFYDKSEGIIYLKRPSGEMTSTRAYPSFFVYKKDRNQFPASDFAGSILDWVDEDDYWRVILEPKTDRDTINEMITSSEDVGIQIFEADVSPVRRWFSDTGSSVAQKYRCLFFDLETHPLRIGFDDEAKRQHRIISFAAYDQEGHSWFVAANKSSDEEELIVIKKFFKIAKEYDVLLAWNGDDYDFFVLRARCKHHKFTVDWRLWNWLDHMRVVKKLLMSIPDPAFKRSFALDKVGENVLGIRKIVTSVKGGQLHKLLGERVGELEAYNRRDVEIMLGIEAKREFLVLQFALCSICRTFPNRGSTFPNMLADGLLLRLAVQEGRHFKSRKYTDRDDEDNKYEGAFVLDPKVGFHLNVQVTDFASLYPSIILSWNMSNETKIDGEKNCPENTVDQAIATATGIRFRTDFEGIIPKALRQLISKRNEYKARLKQLELDSEEYKNIGHLSTAVKVVANSFYGLLGNEGSRYHDRDIARSVTLTGQLLIREINRFFEQQGYEVISSDTDSTFIKCNEEVVKRLLVQINDEFVPNLLSRVGCRENAVRMEYDKGYKSLLIVTKKRYAGKLSLHKGRSAPEDMEPEIKGLETQRSDIIRYAQRLQTKYINLLLDPNVNPIDIDAALRRDGEEFFQQKTHDLESIVITKGVSKHPSEYKPMTTAARIAKWLIDNGHEFFVGMKIPFVVIEHKPNVIGIHADEFDGEHFDKHYYWEKLILPPVLRLIEARFPNFTFSRFDQPMQTQFDFSSQAMHAIKVKKTMTQKIMKTVKIVKKPKTIREVKPETYTITIPESAGESTVKGIVKLAKNFPGRYQLRIIITIPKLADANIATDQCVSMECLHEIKKLFHSIQIDPIPL